MQLFSRMVIGDLASPTLRNIVHSENDSRQAVMATLSAQPVFRPTYRLVKASRNPSPDPISTARSVSCGTPSPR